MFADKIKPMSTTIISYNVNGFRAAAKKGLFDWLKQENPDIICFQETKMQPDQVEAAPFEALGYKFHFWHSAEKKGYSSVATFSKKAPDRVVLGCGIEKYDREGRILRTDFGDWTVLKNKLDMGADYNYSKSITEIKSAAGTAIGPSVGFPQDLRTSTHSLGVHADYHVKDNLSLRVGYRYQQLTTRDWATQDIGPDTIGRVLSLGTQSPKYTAHSVGVAVKYRF